MLWPNLPTVAGKQSIWTLLVQLTTRQDRHAPRASVAAGMDFVPAVHQTAKLAVRVTLVLVIPLSAELKQQVTL